MSLKGKLKLDTKASAADLSKLLDAAKDNLGEQFEVSTKASSSKVTSLIPEPKDAKKTSYLDISRKNGTARLTAPLLDMAVGPGKSKALDTLAPKDPGGEGGVKPLKERLKEKEKTAGKAWFDMAAPMMTPELKRELNMLKLRVALDPKRHYKKQDAKAPPPKYFQMGTIIEGPTEFYSARMTRRERKETLVEQLLADETKQAYFKRKFSEIQEKRQSGGKASYRKKKIIRSGKNRR